MKRVAVVGAGGFVGSALLSVQGQIPDLDICPVGRHDSFEEACRGVDFIIHTACTGRRYWANQNPDEDRVESVDKTARFKEVFPDKKMVFVSSISARAHPHTPYGANRHACERLMDPDRDLVVRLGPMYGGGKATGVLADLISNKTIYRSGASQYAFTDVAYNAMKILECLERTGLIELGAKDGIELEHLRVRLGSTSNFEGDDDTQIPHDPLPDAPTAQDFYDDLAAILD